MTGPTREQRRQPIIFCALGLTAGVMLLVSGCVRSGIVDFYRDTLTASAFGIWCAGLVASTRAPPVLATAFWLGAARMRHGWVLHMLLLPALIAVLRTSIAVMLRVAGEPDADGPTGWATDPAALLMLVAALVYYGALGRSWLVKGRRPPPDR